MILVYPSGISSFFVSCAFHAEYGLAGSHRGSVEQTLIDVSNLLNAEGAKGNAPGL